MFIYLDDSKVKMYKSHCYISEILVEEKAL